jgi:hypothetical protein
LVYSLHFYLHLNTLISVLCVVFTCHICPTAMLLPLLQLPELTTACITIWGLYEDLSSPTFLCQCREACYNTNVATDCEILVWLQSHVSGMHLQRAVYELHFHYISYTSIFSTPVVRETQKCVLVWPAHSHGKWGTLLFMTFSYHLYPQSYNSMKRSHL